jgi:hypothetical protein
MRSGDGGAAPYLDCRPAHEHEQAAIDDLLQEDWLTGSIDDQAVRTRSLTLVPRHLDEVKTRRVVEIERNRNGSQKSACAAKFLHWQHRALELEREEQAGKQQRLNSQNARRYVDMLTDRPDKRLAELSKERANCAAAARSGKARRLSCLSDGLRHKHHLAVRSRVLRRPGPRVSRSPWRPSMDTERRLRREPRDVSAENRGYDIESRDPESGSLIFIEVKGRADGADTITITRNEMLTAFNAEDAYVLAVVPIRERLCPSAGLCPQSDQSFWCGAGRSRKYRGISVFRNYCCRRDAGNDEPRPLHTSSPSGKEPRSVGINWKVTWSWPVPAPAIQAGCKAHAMSCLNFFRMPTMLVPLRRPSVLRMAPLFRAQR